MITEWENIEAFRRHLEKMGQFRQAHRNVHGNMRIALNDMPQPYDPAQPDYDENDITLLTARGNPVVVPIWKIEPAQGSQN